ncbi:MAG: efflux RND transporter periplasmic adaptor subunit [Saprospiraceae bacterium]|nr:efflux RND transporter periplasmic adaptor subunit [Saprospiraceae bacterium]
MNTRRIISITLALLAVVAAVIAISWRLSENKGTMEEKAQITQVRNTTVAVATAPVAKETFSSDFTVNGTFQPSKELTVTSDVNGRITSLKIDEGSYVKQGQLILTVDNQLLNNQLKSLRVNLEKSKKDLARMQNLLKDGGVTETQYEEVKVGVEGLEIQIESLQKQINDTYLKAPLAGTVNQMMVENGSYIAPGAPIANIVSTNPIELEVYLTEDQVVAVKTGQRVNLTADVFGNKQIAGSVSFIDVKADASKRFPVKINLANPGNLKAGMNGKATFSAGRPVATIAVPREAFVGSVQEGKIFILNGNKVSLRQVTPGTVHGNKVEVLSGLSEGETVITSGQINLQEGTEVNVIK